MDQIFKNKMRRLRILNMINMILQWVSIVFLTILLATVAYLGSLDGLPETAANNTRSGILIVLIVVIGLITATIVIANFVTQILCAVMNNNSEVKEVYEKEGLGVIPGIMSIVGIFVLKTILATVLYFYTSKTLKKYSK